MAHYTATVTLVEHGEVTSASMRVFRVFDYGAAPKRPVWETRVEFPSSTTYNPADWLRIVLGRAANRI